MKPAGSGPRYYEERWRWVRDTLSHTDVACTGQIFRRGVMRRFSSTVFHLPVETGGSVRDSQMVSSIDAAHGGRVS